MIRPLELLPLATLLIPRLAVAFSPINTDILARASRGNPRQFPAKDRTPASPPGHPPSTSALNAVREATFGMGCFWEPAESLLKQPGVLATTVGYMGNAKSNSKPPPTYDTVCFGNDYVEAVRVAYDDEILSYPELLDYFFEFQKPGIKRQYSSVIFVPKTNKPGSSSEEEKTALQWKEECMETKQIRKDNLPYSIVEIEPMETPFYRAEEYHQRYWEKQRLRALVGVALIAGASGAYDKWVSLSSLNAVLGTDLSLDTVCNATFLVGAGWMLLERLIARDVRELRDGDFVEFAKKQAA